MGHHGLGDRPSFVTETFCLVFFGFGRPAAFVLKFVRDLVKNRLKFLVARIATADVAILVRGEAAGRLKPFVKFARL
jgi:hypothetical protein